MARMANGGSVHAATSWSFSPSAADISTARNQVADFVAVNGFAARCEDVRLMVSELVTNAIVHASSPCQITVTLTSSSLRVEVADTSSVNPTLQRPSLTEVNGRGLFIVQALATTWGVSSHHGGKTVWFELAGLAAGSGSAAG